MEESEYNILVEIGKMDINFPCVITCKEGDNDSRPTYLAFNKADLQRKISKSISDCRMALRDDIEETNDKMVEKGYNFSKVHEVKRKLNDDVTLRLYHDGEIKVFIPQGIEWGIPSYRYKFHTVEI